MADPTRAGALALYVAPAARTWLAGEDAAGPHRALPGTVVLADVSGFTRMSERLARLGRVGAEHLTGIIQRCFGRLLEEADRFGGTLLKFGGDALAVFFDGDAHGPRAAAAAVAMRTALREDAEIQTEAGRVVLRMTVGVHSDVFDFFLVGGSHRELVLAGPAASAAVAVEQHARSGEIVVSGATAATLPASALGGTRGAGRLLRAAPAAPDPPRGPRSEATGGEEDLVPVGLREVLAAGEGASEHRRVTVAFLTYGGFDAVLTGSGPDAAARRLHELVAGVQEVVDARGLCFLGTDLAADGGKILLTAGAPVSCGGDEEQMLLALREILDRGTTLPVRIGVNAGPVFAGVIGTRSRRTYTVMGDAVNLAARVMGRAESGSVVATTAVLDASRTLFATRPLEPFTVKGKRRPVAAAVVGPPRGARLAVAAADLPLVGRDRELATLQAAVPAGPGAPGAFVEVVGEAGSGKSRLVAEVERRLDGVPVHRVGCRLYQRATPYFPIRELTADLLGLRDLSEARARGRLRDVVARAAPDAGAWPQLVRALIGGDQEEPTGAGGLDDRARRRRLHEALDALLAALVPGPALVCFEDGHWMDDASGELLRLLASRARERSWLLVLTRRDVAGGFTADDGLGARVDLEPLGRDASVRLVEAARAGGPLPRPTVEAVVARADGNPLFLLEIVSALQAGGELDALPETVEGLIAARIDRLPPPERSLLRRLAVLGSWFREEYAVAVVDIRPDAPTWTRLAEFLAVEADGSIRFRHALVRDVAYAGLPFATRRELHSRVAERILATADRTAEGVDSLLSLHFFAAQRYEEAWKYSRLAAESAREVYANTEAVSAYRRALVSAQRLGAGPVEEAELLEALGDVQDLAGCYADAQRAYAGARRCLPDDPLVGARLLLKEAFVAERNGALSLAIRRIRRAQRRLEGLGEPEAAVLRARLRAWDAAIRAGEGRMKVARSVALEAIELAETVGDEGAIAQALVVLDHAEVAAGVHHDWSRTRRALDIHRRRGDLGGIATASNNLGAAAYLHGRWGEALSWYRQARDARVQLGDPVGAAMIDANIAEIMMEQGHLDPAEELLTDALSVQEGAGDGAAAFTTRLLGLVAAYRGDTRRAHGLVGRSRAESERQGAHHECAEADLAAAEILVRERRADETLDVLDRLLADDATRGALEPFAPMVQRLRGVALVQRGDRAAGRAVLADALAAARADDHTFAVALLLDQLAEVDAPQDPAGAARARAEASALFGTLGVVRPSRCPV